MRELDDSIREMLEDIEIEATVDAYRAVAESAPQLGARIETVGGATCAILTGVFLAYFNRAMGLGVTHPATEADVEAIVGLFGERRAWIQLSPMAEPADLHTLLEAQGFAVWNRTAKFIRDLSPRAPAPEPTELRVEQISTDQTHVFAETIAAGFGAPPVMHAWFEATVGRPSWLHYLAYDGDTPVAGATMFVKDNAAELFGAGTLLEHRRRGAQSVLLRRRIADAAGRGCRWAVVETDEETPAQPNTSYRNIRRAGFRLAYLRPNYQRV